MRSGAVAWMVGGALFACGDPSDSLDSGGDGNATDSRFDMSGWPSTVGGDERPALVYWPENWDGTSLLPVVVMLHGYGATGIVQDIYMQLRPRIETYGFIYVIPEGLKDASGAQYWNANPYCCDFYGSGVDDVGYLMGLIDELEASMPVDPDRVVFTGHSNGGYMSHRLACEHPDRIAGIASLAGLAQPYGTDCALHPVSVLQMHGDQDASVPYEDSSFLPGARASVETYIERFGCDMGSEELEPRDYAVDIEGDDARIERWTGCGGEVLGELWTLQNSGHVPVFTEAYRDDLVSWLMDRRRAD